MNDNFYIKQLKPIGDERGSLIALESLSEDIPFQIKRIYYLFDNISNLTRGQHAHKKLHQAIICMHGSVSIKLDDGKASQIFNLSSKTEALIIKPGLWRELYNFGPQAVVLVLASEHYDPSDYINDYQEFLKYKESL